MDIPSNSPISHVMKTLCLVNSYHVHSGRNCGGVLSIWLLISHSLSSQCLLHGLTHEEPGFTLIPVMSRGNVVFQSLICEDMVPKREGKIRQL